MDADALIVAEALSPPTAPYSNTSMPNGFSPRPRLPSTSLPNTNNPLVLVIDRTSLGQNQINQLSALQNNELSMMTPRSAFAALMSAVHVLKEKPDASPLDLQSSAMSPFPGSSHSMFMPGPNPWAMNLPSTPTVNTTLTAEQVEMSRMVNEIVSMKWENQDQLQRPPRDMKRFDKSDWYVVCRVLQWGKNPALLVRKLKDPHNDFGLYKPPAAYSQHKFKAGDRIKLTEVGYSESRNRVATGIIIEANSSIIPEPSTTESDLLSTSPAPSNDSAAGTVNTSKRKRNTRKPAAKSSSSSSASSKSDTVAGSSQSPTMDGQLLSSADSLFNSDTADEASIRRDTTPTTSIAEVTSAELQRILDLPWPTNLGSKPPRDMKRLDPAKWYVVCKTARRGDSAALFLRCLDDPEENKGFFKPPAKFAKHSFSAGDLVQLATVGYSPGRNKVALDIRIEKSSLGTTTSSSSSSSSAAAAGAVLAPPPPPMSSSELPINSSVLPDQSNIDGGSTGASPKKAKIEESMASGGEGVSS